MYQHLQAMAPESVMEYYNKNWHAICNEWVMGMTFNTGNFMNKTNNRLESFNGKLKSVISTFSTLEDFVEKLFIVLDCVRLERDKNAIQLVEKCNVTVEGKKSVVIDVMENIQSIILPAKIRTCGRPKRAILTTIGLPKRLKSERALTQKTETKIKKKGKYKKHDNIAVDPDEPTYCLCGQISYGEMICCDNDLCPIEWFHFSCISLQTKPKDRPNKMKPKAQLLKELECYNKEKEDKA
ncbi:chromatin modification-related protein YNG2-like, partial [Aphis craccivora]